VPPRNKTQRLFAEHQSAEFELLMQHIPQLLCKKAKPILDFAPTTDVLQNDVRLHELRIQTKKLRYSLEILKSLLPAALGESAIESSRSLPNILGEFHDDTVLIQRLQRHRQELLQKGLLLLSHGCSQITVELPARGVQVLARPRLEFYS